MELIIVIAYVINLMLLLSFHMHMFQLNSYFPKKQLLWLKKNIKKVSIQISFIVITIVLLQLKGIGYKVICLAILILSIIYNFPKNKAKVQFNITNRVKRMYVTEALLMFMFFLGYNRIDYICIKLAILNILALFIGIIANYINFPIEALNKKRYINQAKKKLQQMPELIVIGVTGSYGKTSVKNFLTKVLSSKYEVLTTPQNYNTTMGIVKTIREDLKPIHQIFICEMGATKLGDIKEICEITKPKLGVITAIGPQHLESFKTINNVIKAKYELAQSVTQSGGITFVNCNNEYIAKRKHKKDILTYGINDESLNYNSYDLTCSSNGLAFKMIDKQYNEEVEFKTKLIGKHNVVNLTVALAIANYLGIPLKELKRHVREIKGVEHRLQLITRGDMTIIDDSYNSNPVSSKAALDTLSQFEGVKIIVTPGLIELGKQEKKFNIEFGKNITEVCDYVFLVNSKSAKYVSKGLNAFGFSKKKIFEVNTPQEAINKILALNIKSNKLVLLENDLPDNYNL